MGLDSLTWCAASGGDKPKDAIQAGVDSGNKVYVARAHHEGIIIPGKLHKTHDVVYIPYNTKEVMKSDYEVCTNVQILSRDYLRCLLSYIVIQIPKLYNIMSS